MTIYNITGWGKGKTTSAIGITARALANDEKVVFAQFMKSGKDRGIDVLMKVDELWSDCENFEHLAQGIKGFQKENCTEFWEKVSTAVVIKRPSLLILDEFNVAMDFNLFDCTTEEMLEQLKLINASGTDIYITGRIHNHKLRHQMIELADIATNCYCEAHNYNRSCKKCGMEFSPHYEFCPICGTRLSESIKAKIGREC